MVSFTMKHIWILAWSWPIWSPVFTSNFSETSLKRHTSNYSETSVERTSINNVQTSDLSETLHLLHKLNKSEVKEQERSLKKRQLDFGGGGGGVNRFVNGEDDDFYDDNYYNEINDVEYWDSAVVSRYRGATNVSYGRPKQT